jgi:hypothetical protein
VFRSPIRIRSRKFLGLQDPDPLLFVRIRIWIRLRVLSSTSKKIKCYLSLKTDVNVPTESNKQKNLEKTYYLLASWKSLTKRAGPDAVQIRFWLRIQIRICKSVYGSKDPDPFQNVTDSEHWWPYSLTCSAFLTASLFMFYNWLS